MRIAAFFLAIVLFFSLLPPALGATGQDPQFERRRQQDPSEVEREREMAKRRNQERHEALRKDTDRLLQLATELKESVDESSENQLSLEVIRKAEDIEKLARQVRNKMRGQ